MHGDHCMGLLGLIQTMAMNSRERPVDIFGPTGIEELLKQGRRILGFGLPFPLNFTKVQEGIVVKEQEYVVKACRAEHDAESYAYCLQENPRPGVFQKDKAKKLNIPEGNLWSQLQHGSPIIVGRRTILPRQVLGQKRQSRKIGFSGDTRPTPGLARFFKGCNVLIFDATYGDQHADKAVQNLHSTAREAASIANNAGVDLLVLTHFSARYLDVSSLLLQAAMIHSKVMVATDQMSIEIPYPE